MSLGAAVVEHACDYSEAVTRARLAASQTADAYFVDDENSPDLLTGYAVASEVAKQIADRNIVIDAEHPLVAYLPCGVGGAPSGIALGLKSLFGQYAICVFVDPVASACVLVVLASGIRPPP